jgi:hypothetical protein
MVEELTAPLRSPLHSPLRSPLRSPLAGKWDAASAAVADAILDTLQQETDGLVIDGLLNRTLVRTASVDSASTPAALLTYTAPSAKFVMNSSGVLVSASTIRTDYNAAGVAQGILIEEARTNLCLRSEDFNTTWTGTNLAAVSTNAIAAPDGTTTADLPVLSAGNAAHLLFQSVSTTNAATYAFSVYAKKGNHRYLNLSRASSGTDWHAAVFDLDSGLSVATQTGVGATGTHVSSEQLSMGNGWYRLTVVGSMAGSATVRIGYAGAATGNTFGSASDITYNASGAETLYLWGAQLELGAFATSYIATAGATVTRAIDNISLATSAFPSVVSAGTVVGQIGDDPKAGTSGFFPIPFELFTDANNRVSVYGNDTSNWNAVINGSAASNVLVSAVGAGTAPKFAFAWAANDAALSVNGGAAVDDDGTVTVPASLTTLYLGTSGALLANARLSATHLKFLKVTPRRVNNAGLVTESTP